MDKEARKVHNKNYYDKHREEIRRKAREKYAAAHADDNHKRGRKPGPFGSYKEKWLNNASKTETAAQ